MTMMETEDINCDRSTWLKTDCPFCGNEEALMEDPDLPETGRFVSGICDGCEGLFEYDRWDYAD
jgi:hypothetical protein